MTFWDHLDEMRGMLVRIILLVLVAGVGTFFLKDQLFQIVLAPASSDFVMYRLIGTEPFALKLINTELTELLFVHLKLSIYAGLLVVSPYVLYLLFGFVSPALYEREKHYAVWIVSSAYFMFMVGTIANYFVIFPFTVHFLGTYHVSDVVTNMLSLQSYTDTLIAMNLMMGLVFELPVVCRLLSMMGVLRRGMMTRFRRHAFVAIIMAAAIITPTTDAFTLFVVALPIYLLYELSIPLVRK